MTAECTITHNKQTTHGRPTQTHLIIKPAAYKAVVAVDNHAAAHALNAEIRQDCASMVRTSGDMNVSVIESVALHEQCEVKRCLYARTCP